MTKVHEYISAEQVKDYDYVIYTSASVIKSVAGVSYNIYRNYEGKSTLIVEYQRSDIYTKDSELAKYEAIYYSLLETYNRHINLSRELKLNEYTPKIAVVSTLELVMEQILGKKKIVDNSAGKGSSKDKNDAVNVLRRRIENKDIAVDFFHVKSDKRKQVEPILEKVAKQATKMRDLQVNR